MTFAKYNKDITISTRTDSETSGDVSESWSTPVVVRAKVTQIDGSRYLREEELIDRKVFKIECWDNDYDNDIRIGFGDYTLYPIRPITKNPNGSFLNECLIYAATK
jgi:hypothetical protein